MNLAPAASSASVDGTDPVAMLMLRKAMEMQRSNAQQLLQALPQPVAAPDPTATVGSVINTFA